jgi:hypothetical protein
MPGRKRAKLKKHRIERGQEEPREWEKYTRAGTIAVRKLKRIPLQPGDEAKMVPIGSVGDHRSKGGVPA